jgi:uncharacterized protein (DUF4213/DUF364 family)
MTLAQQLQSEILPGEILSVQVGLWRTAVLARTATGICCGLAASLSNQDIQHKNQNAVRDAGILHTKDYQDLVALFESPSHTEAAIGLAAINALLPSGSLDYSEVNAHDYLAVHGRGKNIALIGHFPFIEQLRLSAKNLWVFDLHPYPGDLPAEAATDYLPLADYVALTATTLINHTFEDLIRLCRPDTKVVMLGPSTPMTQSMFACGVDILSGTQVVDPVATFYAVSQGASMHSLQEKGVIRYVTAIKP